MSSHTSDCSSEFEKTVRLARRMTGGDGAFLLGDNQKTIIASSGIGWENVPEKIDPIDSVTCINDLQRDPSVPSPNPYAPFRCMIQAPITVNDTIQGHLIVVYDRPKNILPTTKKNLSILADHAAEYIENYETRRRLEKIQFVFENISSV